MSKISRRRFIGTSVAAVIGAGMIGRGQVFGANERIRVCCIGLNGRGKAHLKEFSTLRDSEVVALCDVDRHVLEKRATELEHMTGKKPKTYVDMREAFADSSIDAVSIATPNHWHALATVLACQAGKDVYVEKPMTHDIWEGRQIMAAAQKYGRIVQTGVQRRSDPKWLRAIQRLRAGAIGDVYMARAIVFKSERRGALPEAPQKPAPEWLDWNLWQGPAQAREYCDNYVPYNWHWFWDYGNGEIGNQGVHQIDVAMWGLDKGLPIRVYSSGGRYTYKDQGETPNTQLATYTYADGSEMVVEVRNRWTNGEADTRVGNLFYGAEGYFVEADQGHRKFAFYSKNDSIIRDDKDALPDSKGPFGNFIKAVRSRKPEDVFATAKDGHRAAVHAHIANISYRLGRSLRFDPAQEVFVDDSEANAMLKRTYREGFVLPEEV